MGSDRFGSSLELGIGKRTPQGGYDAVFGNYAGSLPAGDHWKRER
jgi:hypothetical protein